MPRTESRVAFRDASGAEAWLAEAPQENAFTLLTNLQTQIEAFNRDEITPRERMKTLEVLRKAAYAASQDCRRFQGDEHEALYVVCRFWRVYGAGYRRCLQACVEGDASLQKYAARVAHRVSFCLRVEQMMSIAAGDLPASGFWKEFHALFLTAEQIGCTTDAVDDRLLRETRSSSVLGQYTMALMLHLAQPFSLSSIERGAAILWLSRWREQAQIDESISPGAILLDMSTDQPIVEKGETAKISRFLILNGVQRKIRARLKALARGESPESLKLGRELSSQRCVTLLTALYEHFQKR